MRHQLLSLLSVVLCLSACLGWACSNSHENPQNYNKSVAGPATRAASLVNVPTLVGVSIDELQRRLGPMRPVPAHLADPAALVRKRAGEAFDSTGAFQHRGLLLVATFSNRTRQVSDLLVVGKDEQTVMQQARLEYEATDYLLLPVFNSQNTTEFLGLRVVPKATDSTATSSR